MVYPAIEVIKPYLESVLLGAGCLAQSRQIWFHFQRVGQYLVVYVYDINGNIVSETNYIQGITYFYHTNLRGDIVSITNTSGNILAQYSYDPWGNQLSYSGTVTQPFRYAGYYYDEETGLYYLKSRYYSPQLGRFLTKDAYGYIDYSNPQTLNLYSYCNNNPVSHVDPSGHWVDTVLDAGFLTMDIHDIVNDPSDGWGWASLGADVVGALLPGVTGGRLAVKGLEHLLEKYRLFKVDCSEIAENFKNASGGIGKIYNIVGKRGSINAYEYGNLDKFKYHQVYCDGKYIHDPRYSDSPVLKDDYFRDLRKINPDGFDVYELP